MLDRLKLLQELELVAPKLFRETTDEYASARALFNWLLEHPDAIEFLKKTVAPYPVPSWQGELNATWKVDPQSYPYQVVAVDGSQIYPDKHQGVSCYLINSGVVHFTYGESSSVRLFSVPQIYTQMDDTDISEDMVNCRRGEHEFQMGLQESAAAQSDHPELPLLFLCDGSLIFWHLETKSKQIKERFLKRYIEQLDDFYQKRIPVAGYISLPKSKELVALLRNSVAHNLFAVKDGTFDTIIDTTLVSFFLPEGHRSTVFEHNSALAASYPPQVRPHFFYLNVGHEIARVEIPAWVGQDEALVTRVASILIDQCVKGNGYPVAASESHEQAVVKAAEREFFFAMLYKMGVENKYVPAHSQKSLKKRFVSV